MANIELIKALRERTGAGILDCKNALTACGDNLDKATDWLREKGIAKAAKKADRIAAEGLAAVYICPKCGNASIVEINCETDFVAKADPFKELVKACAQIVLEKRPADVAAAKELTKELFTNATVKLGEKLDFRRFSILEKAKPDNGIGSYIHMGGTHAVLVLLEKDDPELAQGIAMHIAANAPKYILESDVSKEYIESETKIQREVAKNDPKLQNKPEQALARIIEGKVHKGYAEVTLADQEYLLDNEKTVGQLLTEKGNKVLKFVHYTVGEGIEKRVDDFAAEVKKQANN
ncbi:MAG: translation elongation factor Ts [Bacilli bacterium]|jgi:elongation factor Ts